MGAILGLLFGIGVVLIWHALTVPLRPREARPFAQRTRNNLAEAGLASTSPWQVFGAQALLALISATAVLVLTKSVAVAAVFGIFGALVPHLMVLRIRRRRQADLRELWPEVVDNLTSGIRAGLSLPEALSAIGDRGPQRLREPFQRFGADYRTTGQWGGALDRLKQELADPVGDRVCESLRVAREVGGTDLGRLLSTLSAFLRDDARARSELLARQSWGINAARMAVAAPWLILILLATQSTTLEAYDTPTGAIILATGAVLSVLAYRLMLRIGRLPQERRVLK